VNKHAAKNGSTHAKVPLMRQKDTVSARYTDTLPPFQTSAPPRHLPLHKKTTVALVTARAVGLSDWVGVRICMIRVGISDIVIGYV